jgi:hypothetical protein
VVCSVEQLPAGHSPISGPGAFYHMARNNVTEIAKRKISETEQLIADQVGRVYGLKSKHLSVGKAETKLDVLCTKLVIQRAKFSKFASSVRTYTLPKKILRETAEVGGPRWRIGWGGIS